MTKKRLYRSRKDRVIWGVAGGLAEYLDIDPILVRIAFVILAFVTHGLMILAYIILAIAVPSETGPVVEGASEEEHQQPEPEAEVEVVSRVETEEDLARDEEVKRRRRYILGGGLVIVGAIILISNLSPWLWQWDKYWPILLIAAGAAVLVAGMRRK